MEVHDGEFWSRQSLLIISPHADDEAFGCAGTIAKVKASGGRVFVILVSVGTIVQYTGEGERSISGDVRTEEFGRAMASLGVDDYDILLTDSEKHLRLDAMPRRDLVGLLESGSRLSFNRLNPTVIALPAVSYNQDHEAVFKAGFTACRPHLRDVKSFQKIVLGYDNPAISWSLEREKFHPNFYVDISAFLPAKMQAVSLYRSQLKPSPHHASLESIEYLARMRGREISVEAAEAFMCYRFVT
jgi:N-acetylglucosamine malate deacetylase 1